MGSARKQLWRATKSFERHGQKLPVQVRFAQLVTTRAGNETEYRD
jgi:hypothetical protein